jgi:hypothetical protein
MSREKKPREAIAAEEQARKAREAQERRQRAFKALLELKRQQIITSELIH